MVGSEMEGVGSGGATFDAEIRPKEDLQQPWRVYSRLSRRSLER